MKIKYNKETYKDIPGYEGQYQVSVRGNVRSLDRIDARGYNRKGKPMRYSLTAKGGYRQVSLCKGGKIKCYTVHKLVALTFIGPRPEGMDIDHWDKDPSNNKLCNLNYMTHADNIYRSKKNMSSQHRGVSWHKASKQWMVTIYTDGKEVYLGYFTDELEAAACYQEAAKKNNLK